MSTFGSNSADNEDGSSKQQRSATSEEIDTEDEIRLNESTVRKRACCSTPSDIEDGALKRQRLAPEDEDGSPADYVNLSPQDKEKLDTFLEEIVTKTVVDFSNPEIQDIQSAVSEMIGRIQTWINERGGFSISRTELCGSMAELTAMWKCEVKPEEPFIEFDFLAVLQGACDIERGCPECFRVNTVPANLDVHGLLKQYFPSSYNLVSEDEYIKKVILKACFTRETNNCLASCGCLKVLYPYGDLDLYIFEPSSTCSEILQGCDKCTVDKPTGTLRVKTSAEMGRCGVVTQCSLIFDWTSKAKTLCIRDNRCLPETEKMDNLTIHVDFLPALEVFQSKQQSADVAACSSSDLVLNPASSEYVHNCFLVPKHCDVCDQFRHNDTWRRSGCRAEIDIIVNKMSDKHRKCYQVLKYLSEITEANIRHGNYVLKIAVLHHNRSCSDTSEDCAECVFKVLNEFQHAFKTKQLKSFHSQANLLEQVDIRFCASDLISKDISALREAMCSAVPESDLLPLPSFLDKVKNAYGRIYRQRHGLT